MRYWKIENNPNRSFRKLKTEYIATESLDEACRIYVRSVLGETTEYLEYYTGRDIDNRIMVDYDMSLKVRDEELFIVTRLTIGSKQVKSIRVRGTLECIYTEITEEEYVENVLLK